MNILQIHNFYKHRGGESSVLEAEKEMLLKNGHNILQLTADNKQLSKYPKARKDFYNKLNNVIKQNEIDAAHIHNVFHIIGSKIYKVLSKHPKDQLLWEIKKFYFVYNIGEDLFV